MQTSRWFGLRLIIAAVVLMAATGCGRGMKLEVTTDNDSPQPGEPIEYSVTVTNDTACTTDETTSVPPFGSGPVRAIVIGFTEGGDTEGAELCRAITVCRDLSCFDEILGENLGQGTLEELKNQANAILGETLGDVMTPSCEPAPAAPPGFFVFACVFPPLPPGGSSTATFATTVPDLGSLTAVQFGAAVAGATGADCRPGFNFGNGAWSIGGCIPKPAVTGAPTASSAMLPLLGASLLALGSLALYRQRRS